MRKVLFNITVVVRYWKSEGDLIQFGSIYIFIIKRYISREKSYLKITADRIEKLKVLLKMNTNLPGMIKPAYEQLGGRTSAIPPVRATRDAFQWGQWPFVSLLASSQLLYLVQKVKLEGAEGFFYGRVQTCFVLENFS
jgi:hypothetical protein